MTKRGVLMTVFVVFNAWAALAVYGHRSEQARLADIKKGDLGAYFDAISTDHDRWQKEVEQLNPDQKKAMTARQIKMEIGNLAASPAEDHGYRLQIYKRLVALDPANKAYRQGIIDEDAAQIRASVDPPRPERILTAADIGEGISVANFTWHKGGFDRVLIASFGLKNSNKFAVRDVILKCTVYAPSGTRLGTNAATVYEIIRAGKTKTVNEMNIGLIHSQAQSAGCEVTSAQKID